MSWQPWTVAWTNRARRDLRRLDRQTVARIVQGVMTYAASGHGDVRKLEGTADQWRLRVGRYRVLYYSVDDLREIRVLRVGHRREIYR